MMLVYLYISREEVSAVHYHRRLQHHLAGSSTLIKIYQKWSERRMEL